MNLSPARRVLGAPNQRTTLPTDKRILDCELLVTQCQRGDPGAFDRLVKMWERPLFYYLRRLAPSEADAWDLLQETWLKTFRSIRSLRDPAALPPFLYATARNAAITRLRLKRENPTPCDEASALDCAFIAFDDAEQVHHALDQLPLAQREAVTLYFLEDLSIDEIAQVLAVPPGTVKSRLHYGKQAIRGIIDDGGHRAQ